MAAIEIRPEPLPVTLTTGVCPRGAQVRARAGLERVPRLVEEADPRAQPARDPCTWGHVDVLQVATASSSRSVARRVGAWGVQPIRWSGNATPFRLEETWNIRPISVVTRASVQCW